MLSPAGIFAIFEIEQQIHLPMNDPFINERDTDEEDDGYGENFDSWDLLHSIDFFDGIRETANDSDINRPPEFRFKLQNLHEKAMKLKFTQNKQELYEFSLEIDELSTTALDMLTHAEKLYQALSKLESDTNKSLGDFEPDEN